MVDWSWGWLRGIQIVLYIYVCLHLSQIATIATVEWVFVNFIFLLFHILNTKYCWVFKVWVVVNFRMTLKVYLYMHESTEAATRRVLCKKVFLEISQNSQENTCARVLFLIKLQASGTRNSGTSVFM